MRQLWVAALGANILAMIMVWVGWRRRRWADQQIGRRLDGLQSCDEPATLTGTFVRADRIIAAYRQSIVLGYAGISVSVAMALAYVVAIVVSNV